MITPACPSPPDLFLPLIPICVGFSEAIWSGSAITVIHGTILWPRWAPPSHGPTSPSPPRAGCSSSRCRCDGFLLWLHSLWLLRLHALRLPWILWLLRLLWLLWLHYTHCGLQERTLELKHELSTAGAVYALESFNGKLLAGGMATQGSNPSLADRVPHTAGSATHTFAPRLGQSTTSCSSTSGSRARARRGCSCAMSTAATSSCSTCR